MGRTRPKKLTNKASIPIVREDQIDIIDDEVTAALQPVETGVEKAEESVCRLYLPQPLSDICHVTSDVLRRVPTHHARTSFHDNVTLMGMRL